MIKDFSSEIMEIKKNWQNIFQLLKVKNVNPESYSQ